MSLINFNQDKASIYEWIQVYGEIRIEVMKIFCCQVRSSNIILMGSYFLKSFVVIFRKLTACVEIARSEYSIVFLIGVIAR